MNLNRAIIAGRLTDDPENRVLPSGSPVTNFSLATNRVWTNKDGEKQEDVQFHNIVVFGRLAEIADQYLAKGRLCLIEGRIQTRSWEDQNGNRRYRTEIIAENLQLGPRSSNDPQRDSNRPPVQTKQQSGGGSSSNSGGKNQDSEEDDDDIPVIEQEDDFDTDDIPF